MAFLIISQAQKGNGNCVIRELKQLFVVLIIFQNISNVAGSDSQRFRHQHSVLGGNHGILNGKQQIRFVGFLPGKPLLPGGKLHAAL